jgi:hypothetical protein
MATVPTRPTSAESIEERFQRLAAVWRAETAYVSSSSDLIAHPAFQEIVGLGQAAIPLLLRELAKRSGHWHRALRRITGANPVPPADRGDIDKAAEAWLRWGKEQGYDWLPPSGSGLVTRSTCDHFLDPCHRDAGQPLRCDPNLVRVVLAPPVA